jgi:serine/threonine protein kinase
MGVVYKAIDPLIDRTVAIKTINLDLSKEELDNFEQRFQREVQSAGRLSHPNIVTIYDVGKTDGVAYMAMEFLQGKELREILDTGVVLPMEKVVHIAAQVADGLAFAHEQGIVHRDIKPANIMVQKNGLVKITDFGIAQMSSGTRTMAGVVLGSPKYMAPEQVVGQQVDGRTDVFALGVVIYEMLTSKTPFSGDNISAIMYQVLNDTPAEPSTINKNVPASLNYIVMKALAKRPEDRYQSAKEMARDLRKYKTMAVQGEGQMAPGSAPTMDRRSKPRAGIGDATQILSRFASESTEKDQTSQDKISAGKGVDAAKTLSSSRLNRILLYAAIPILLLSFSLVIFWGKSGSKISPEPALTTRKTVANAHSVAEPSAPPFHSAGAARPDAGKAKETGLAQPPQSPVKSPAEAREEKRAPVHAKSKPKAEAKSTAKSPAAVAQPGTLSFAITPWGEIYVDGVKRGVSPPLRELKVEPGQHNITIKNGSFRPYSADIDIKPDSSNKIKYKFAN